MLLVPSYFCRRLSALLTVTSALLFMQVSTAAEQRSELRRQMQGAGLKQLESWKSSGLLRDYRVFFNRYVDNDNCDMLSVVSFHRYEDVERWREIEQSTPAGIPAQALKLTTSISTTPVDLMREKTGAQRAAQPVFLIIPYDYPVSTAEYLKYVDGYGIPQFDGWIQEGTLSRYGVYISRYAAGRPWAAMFVFEYNGHQGLGERDQTVAKVRARLASDPAWKAFSDSKQNIRIEKQPVIADELRLN
jgi:hypothetical protein